MKWNRVVICLLEFSKANTAKADAIKARYSNTSGGLVNQNHHDDVQRKYIYAEIAYMLGTALNEGLKQE